MAPSANRRSGYSRRAQYSTFFGYLAGFAGAIVGAILLAVSIVNPGAFTGLRMAAADAATPGGAAAAHARAGGQGFFETVSGYFMAAQKNARLERELAEAKSRLVESTATAEENRRLKALLGLGGQDPQPLLFTQLVSSTASSTRRFATIGAGKRDGVAVGMPVRTPLGLIGRVLETGGASSRVLLITDTESVVPARRATDGVPVFVQGRGDGSVQLRLINLGINPLKRGDVVVTSGSGGLYRPGTPIALVHTLTRDGAIAHVLSDPAASEFVAVEPVWNPAIATTGSVGPASGGSPAPATESAR